MSHTVCIQHATLTGEACSRLMVNVKTSVKKMWFVSRDQITHLYVLFMFRVSLKQTFYLCKNVLKSILFLFFTKQDIQL